MSGFFGMMFPGGGSGGLSPVTPSTYVAFGGTTSTKRVSVYPWNSSTGFGSVYTTPSIPGDVRNTSFVRDNSNFSCSFLGSPSFYVWQWSTLGFGTQYSNPSDLIGFYSGYVWTNNVDAVITARTSNPTLTKAWAWNPASGFGTKYSDGPTLSSVGDTAGVTINGDNTLLAFQSASGAAVPGPVVSVIPWSSVSGFGTKFTNPYSPAVGGSYGPSVTFNLVTNDLIVGGVATSPFIYAYAINPTGFGVRYSSPSTPVGGTVYSAKFSPDGSAVAVGSNAAGSPLKVYRWGAGFGSLYSSPSSTLAAQSVDWSSTGTEIIKAEKSASPFTKAWAWTSSGFGTQFSSPVTVPGVPNSVNFSNQSR